MESLSKPTAVSSRVRLFSTSEQKRYLRKAPERKPPWFMRKPMVPPERVMSEAAPLRKVCHEHRSMPREKPLLRSLRVALEDERSLRMGSWRRPPR